jgi:hypothetical protein
MLVRFGRSGHAWTRGFDRLSRGSPIAVTGRIEIARQRVRLTSVQLTTVDLLLPPVCM